jgi:hypothetical protein
VSSKPGAIHNDFSSDLEERLLEEIYRHDDFEEVPIPEVMTYMDRWFENSA